MRGRGCRCVEHLQWHVSFLKTISCLELQPCCHWETSFVHKEPLKEMRVGKSMSSHRTVTQKRNAHIWLTVIINTKVKCPSWVDVHPIVYMCWRCYYVILSLPPPPLIFISFPVIRYMNNPTHKQWNKWPPPQKGETHLPLLQSGKNYENTIHFTLDRGTKSSFCWK